MFAAKSVGTETRVLADAVQAGASVLTRIDGAVVGVGQTVAALVALGAEALVGPVGVAAGGAVAARRGDGALVDVLVAEAPRVAQLTAARKVQVVAGRSALGAVAAAVGGARIEFGVAGAARVRQLAHALVVGHQIDARSCNSKQISLNDEFN